MKRKTLIAVIVFICLVLLAGVGYVYASGDGLDGILSSNQSDTETSITQAVASTGDLTVSANGTGEIVPVSEVALGFQQAGVLAELAVAPGDKVKAGDVLARLQANRTPAQQAEVLATAEYNAVVAQMALDELDANAGKATAEALLALEQA